MYTMHTITLLIIIAIIAMQAWTLCRLIPFMIGDKIPRDDQHWLNYLLMLEITDYLFSPIINADEAANLSVLIEEHNSEFSRNFFSVYGNTKNA